MFEKNHKTIHANASERDGWWTLRITFSTTDGEGMLEDPVTWRGVCQVPSVDTPVDQSWALMVTMCHMLEREGSVGRVSSGDWPGLW